VNQGEAAVVHSPAEVSEAFIGIAAALTVVPQHRHRHPHSQSVEMCSNCAGILGP
jgi:hypothetical protein